MTLAISNYSELLEQLHSAALDELCWEPFLRQVCEHTQSIHGFFLVGDSQHGMKVLAYGGSRNLVQVQQVYNERYGRMDPWREGFLKNPRIGVIDGEELVPRRELEKMELYRELLQPHDMEYVTMVVIAATPRKYELLSLWRDRAQGVMEESAKELLRLLLPHLQIALQVRRALGTVERRAESAEAVLEASENTSFVLDGAGRVVHQSSSGRRLVEGEDGISFERSRMYPSDMKLRPQFDALVRGCARGVGDAGGAMSFTRRGGRRPLQVLIAPMRLADHSLSKGRVLVLVTDPETSPVHPDAVLKALYGMTHAETEIANGLLMGYSLDEIANLRRVSISTVRTQMKSLLEKTDTRRQGELVRLLGTVPKSMG